MRQNNKKTIWKYLLGYGSIGLVATGVATAIPMSLNHIRSQNIFYKSSKYQNLKVLGKYTNDISGDKNLNNTQFNDHLNAIADKLWYQLRAAGVDADTATTQASIFKANVLAYKPKVSLDAITVKNGTKLSPKLQFITQQYSYLEQEAKKLGVDVVDFDNLEKNIIPQTNETLINSYQSQGCSYDDAKSKADKICDAYLTLLPKAQEQLWDNTKYSMAVIGDSQDPSAMLRLVLSYIQGEMNKRLNVTDTGNFISLMNDYSANGKYDVDSIIDESDLAQLFTYQYDTTNGYNYYKHFHNELPDIGVGTPGEYDMSAIGAISETLPLGIYTGGFGGTYESGQFLPGYTLRVKILNKDVTTDSHFCNLWLQFGVSSANDPNNILWSDLDSQTQALKQAGKFSTTQDTNKGVIKTSLKVTKIENKQYIAEHEYYDNVKQAVINDPNAKPDYNDIWFDNTTSQRAFLDSILDGATIVNDHYDLKNHPIILNDQEVGGIDKPIGWEGVLHTNQELKLIATDVNTNDGQQWLTLNWALIDENNGSKNLNVSSSVIEDNQTLDVLSWNINGQEYKSINVKFDMDPTIKNILHNGEQAADYIDSMNMASVAFNYTSKAAGHDEDLLIANSVCSAFEIAGTIATIALIAVYTAAAVCDFGASSWLVVLATAVGILLTAASVLSALAVIDEGLVYKEEKKAKDVVHSDSARSTIDDVYNKATNDSEYGNLIDKINDPTYVLDKKVEVAKKLWNLKCEMSANQDVVDGFNKTTGCFKDNFTRWATDSNINSDYINDTSLAFPIISFFFECIGIALMGVPYIQSWMSEAMRIRFNKTQTRLTQNLLDAENRFNSFITQNERAYNQAISNGSNGWTTSDGIAKDAKWYESTKTKLMDKLNSARTELNTTSAPAAPYVPTIVPVLIALGTVASILQILLDIYL